MLSRAETGRRLTQGRSRGRRAAGLLFVAAACTGDGVPPTAGGLDGVTLDVTTPAAPLMSLPPPPGTLTAELPASGTSAAAGPLELAGFARRTRVEIRISGLITRFISPNPPWDPSLWNSVERVYGPGGTWNAADLACYGNAAVLFTEGGFVPCVVGHTLEGLETWADTVVVRGAGHARRTNVPDPSGFGCGNPGQPPCHYYDGLTTVTVTPLAAELVVEAVPSEVESGGLVTFTARRRDGGPLGTVTWTWVPGSGDSVSATGPLASGCGSEAVCGSVLTNTSPAGAPVAQVGAMYARAEVAGVDEVAGAGVVVTVPEVDSMPPDTIPPDSVPPDSVPPDTLPPGGEDSVVVQVTLSRDTVRPVLARLFNAVMQEAEDAGVPDSRVDTVRVRVTVLLQPSGRVPEGAALTLVALPVDTSGGHVHDPGTRPRGTFFRLGNDVRVSDAGHRGSVSLTVPGSGDTVLVYRTSGIGGIERLVATVQAAGKTAVDTGEVAVRWPGLQAMAREGSRHEFLEQNPAVPSQRHGNRNHWIEADFRARVLDAFRRYFDAVPEGQRFPLPAPDGTMNTRFVITDVSLEWGGLLDVAPDGPWHHPHKSHRNGQDMDVRSTTLNAAGHLRLLEACSAAGVNCEREPNPREPNAPPHYHLSPRVVQQ